MGRRTSWSFVMDRTGIEGAPLLITDCPFRFTVFSWGVALMADSVPPGATKALGTAQRTSAFVSPQALGGAPSRPGEPSSTPDGSGWSPTPGGHPRMANILFSGDHHWDSNRVELNRNPFKPRPRTASAESPFPGGRHRNPKTIPNIPTPFPPRPRSTATQVQGHKPVVVHPRMTRLSASPPGIFRPAPWRRGARPGMMGDSQGSPCRARS